MKEILQINAPSFKAAFYQFSDQPFNQAPTRRDFYKIWLILNKCTLVIEDEVVTIGRPSIVFLHPLTRYIFTPIERKRRGYWCIFTGEFLDDTAKSQLFTYTSIFQPGGVCLGLNEAVLPVITFYFEQIVKEYSSEYAQRFIIIKHLIAILIHEGQKIQRPTRKGHQQNAATRLATRFVNLLESQFPIASPFEPLALKKPSDFADQLAVHVNHLNAVIQEVTGKSTRQMIADRVLNESKALLYYSDWSVADIAYSLGFEYPNHFTTFFRKNTGLTPMSLRN